MLVKLPPIPHPGKSFGFGNSAGKFLENEQGASVFTVSS
jgi:hypothetical protein